MSLKKACLGPNDGRAWPKRLRILEFIEFCKQQKAIEGLGEVGKHMHMF